MGPRWARGVAAAVVVIVAGMFTSWSGGAAESRPAESRDSGSTSPQPQRKASASPSQESQQELVERHRRRVLDEIASGRDAPDREGLSLVSVAAGSTVFFYVTADGRYCSVLHSAAASASSCTARPAEGIGPAPALERWFEGDTYAAGPAVGLIVAADRETVLSFSCGDERLALRKVRVIEARGATRTIYGVELDQYSAGVLRAEVARADGRHKETLPLGTKAEDLRAGSDWPVCG